MNKGNFSYVGLVIIFSVILAFAPSTLTLALCGAFAVVLTLFFSPKALITSGIISYVIMLLWWGDAVYAATVVLSYLLTGLFIALAIRKNAGFAGALSAGTCAYLVCNTAGTYFSAKAAGYTIMEALVDMPLDEAKEFFAQMSAEMQATEELTVQLDGMMQEMTSLMRSMLPASLMIGAIGFAFLVLVAARFWLLKIGVKISMSRFSDLRADISVTAVCAIICVCAFLASGEIGLILKNAAVVIVVIYAALGAAALLKLMRPKVSKGWIRALLLIVIFFVLNIVSVFCAGFVNTESLTAGILLMFLPVLVFAAIGVIKSLIQGKVEEK